MAISTPTDIVSDVLNAADPAAMETARARLNSGQAALQAQRLQNTDEGFDAKIAMNHLKDDTRLHAANKKDVPESYRKFESMVLGNFLKSMMPDSEEVYGKGATGEIWKGMMAEQIANELAKAGGIGIADKLAENGTTRVRDKSVEESNRSGRMHMATQLIEEHQMKALDKFMPGGGVDKTDKTDKTGEKA
jgi:Rod binding domain-containing protein